MNQPVFTPVAFPLHADMSDACRLVEDYSYYAWGHTYVVPAGFEWDGASIPNFARSFVGSPFDADLAGPSLEHDWSYYAHHLSKRQADDHFRRAMKMHGVGPARRAVIWLAVHVFGVSAWENDADDLAFIAGLRARSPALREAFQ